MVGRVYVEIGSGRQRGAAVPLRQQIRSPVDSNKKNWLVLFFFLNSETKCSQKVTEMYTHVYSLLNS